MLSKSRREFVQLALAALPGAALLSTSSRLGAAAAAAKPNSKVAGVQIGMNVPYSFGPGQLSGDEILNNCVQLGLSAVELRIQPVEVFMGAPAELIYPKKEAKPKSAPTNTKTESAKSAPKIDTAAKLREWRKSASLDRAKEFRTKWESTGVLIEIVKVDTIFKMSDDEVDYAFALAKALGGRAISTEISHEKDNEKRLNELKRIGQFADKHQLLVGYHGHATTGPEQWEEAFALAKFNGANVDIGHFVAGNFGSPVPFLQKYHDRVTHVHIKDRKKNNGPNTPFGEGDTPIVDVLRAIRDNKWNIQATLEYEVKLPAGADRMKEIASAIQFCRAALA